MPVNVGEMYVPELELNRSGRQIEGAIFDRGMRFQELPNAPNATDGLLEDLQLRRYLL